MKTRTHIVLIGLALVAVAGACGSSGDGAAGATTTAPPGTVATTTILGDDPEASETFAVLAGEGVPVDLDTLAANLQDRLIAAGHDEGTAVVDGDRVQVTPGPGPLDAAALDDLLATPGRLEIRPVLEVLPPDCEVATPTGTAEVSTYPELDADGAVVACYSLAPSGLTNDAVEDASATFPNGSWVVDPVFTEAGIEAFNALAAVCVERGSDCPTGMVAIAVDGVVITAPTVNESSFLRDQIQISGGGADPTTGQFTKAEARVLAASLRVEPLPSGLEVVR